METSMLLAKYIGLVYLAVGLGLLFSGGYYKKLIDDMISGGAIPYLGGLMAFVFGLTVVMLHNTWSADWTLIITIFGWLALIKGTCLLIFPSATMKMYEGFMKWKGLIPFAGIFALIIGAILTYFGFWG